MMSSSLFKLRIGLAVVFALTLFVILIQLCYVLWRRRLFRRQHLSRGAESDMITTGSDHHPAYTITSPSKELLYFLCWKNQSRIEPALIRSSTDHPHDHAAVPAESVDEFKLQELYGPSRLLFTIKEEKEELEYYSDNKSYSTDEKKIRVSLEECFEETGGEVVEDNDDQCSSMVKIAIMDGDDDEEERDQSNQFSTPCGSPDNYYTPTPSPSRDHDELERERAPENKGYFV